MITDAILSVCFIYLVIVIIYSIVLFVNQNVTRPTGFYWPTFINKWLGRGPQTFSMASGNVAIRSDLQYTLTNVQVNDCMSNCNISNVCIGFTMYPQSNTCNTFTLISALYPIGTSNVYIMDGAAPGLETYTQYLNQNVLSTTTFAQYTARSTNLTDTLYDIIDCASNCASHTTCNAFTMSGFSCIQQSGPPTLGPAPGQSTYVLGPSQLTSIGAPYATQWLP